MGFAHWKNDKCTACVKFTVFDILLGVWWLRQISGVLTAHTNLKTCITIRNPHSDGDQQIASMSCYSASSLIWSNPTLAQLHPIPFHCNKVKLPRIELSSLSSLAAGQVLMTFLYHGNSWSPNSTDCQHTSKKTKQGNLLPWPQLWPIMLPFRRLGDLQSTPNHYKRPLSPGPTQGLTNCVVRQFRTIAMFVYSWHSVWFEPLLPSGESPKVKWELFQFSFLLQRFFFSHFWEELLLSSGCWCTTHYCTTIYRTSNINGILSPSLSIEFSLCCNSSPFPLFKVTSCSYKDETSENRKQFGHHFLLKFRFSLVFHLTCYSASNSKENLHP